MLAVDEASEIAQEEMWGGLRQHHLKGKRIISSGDRQYDGPGSCAQLCAYSVALVGLEKEDAAGDVEYLDSG